MSTANVNLHWLSTGNVTMIATVKEILLAQQRRLSLRSESSPDEKMGKRVDY